MKKFISFIIIFLLFTIVEAKTLYSNVPDFSNDYIKRMSQSQRYFVTKNSKYGFTSKAVENSKFKTGGLLNESEFNIVGGSRSYLFNGLTFFTMTEGSGKVKTVDPTASGGISELSTSSGVSGVRVTNYIRSGVNVEGYGSRVSPWRVSEKYVVTFKYDDTKITVRPTSVTITRGGHVTVDVLPTTQYTYKPQTTCGVIENGKLRISGIVKDTVCEIEHTLRNYTVTIEAGKSKYGEEAVFDNSITGQGWTLTDSNKKATKKISYNDKISNLPTSSQVHLEGYTLSGWAEDNVAINTSTYKVTKDSVITAVQKQRTFEITYVPHRGTMSTTKKQVTYDEKYSVGGSLSTPTAPVGYTFAGWRLGSETGNPINDDTIVKTASDHELHAIWSANKHTLTANANGGTMSATSGWTLGSGNTTATKTVTYDSQYGTLPTPTWSEHTFEGWHLGSVSGDKITSTTIMKTDSNHTIVAKWYTNVPIPTATTYCTTPTYNGTKQIIVSAAPAGFTWSNHEQKDAGTHTVVAKIATGYTWGGTDFADKSILCNITPATPTISLSAKSATYTGSAISANTATVTLVNNETFNRTINYTYYSTTNCSGTALSGAPTNAGNYSVRASTTAFTNYNASSSSCVAHTINKAASTLSLNPTSGTLTYPTAATSTITTNSNGTLSCKSSNDNVAICSISGNILTITPKANPADNQTATLTISQAEVTNYLATSKTFTATVNRQTISAPTNHPSKTYNGSSQASGITCPTGSTAAGQTSGTNVGTYTHRCNAKSGYKFGSSDYCEVTWTIVQREVTVTAPTVKSGTLTYNGSNQTIAGSAGSCTAGGTMYYYTSNYTTTSAPAFSTSSGWSTTYPSTASGKNAGTYYMWYYCYVSDTTNNKAKSGSSINTALSITKAIGKAASSITCNSLTYTGSSQTLATGSGCSSLSNNTRTNAGSQTVTCNGDANHNDSTKSCSIAASKTATTGSCKSGLVFNGNDQVLASGATNASYTNNSKKDAGTYTVTVTADSNYAFSDGNTSKTLSCSISAQTLGTPSVTITKTGAVTWGTVSNASSYQVSLDGGGWAPAKIGEITISTSVGTHTAAVRAVGEGNYATGSSGSDSAIISNKVVVSYKKEEQTCSGSYSFGSSYPPAYISGSSASCTSSNISCNASNVGKEKVTCSNYTWTQTIQTCSSSKSGATIGCSSSCPSGYPSVEAHCTKVYTKKVYNCSCPANCTGTACTCSWSLSSSTGNLGSCTTVSGTCSVLNRHGTKTECPYEWTSSSYKYCYKTTYSYVNGTPNVFSSSCSVQSKPNCTAANVGSSYITGCQVDQWKEVRTPCNGSYSLGATSTSTVGSCSNNTFTCDSSTVGSTYRKCTANYGCGSGKTEISGKCINRT